MVDFDDLLGRTSRTFALSIRLLPSPLREDVTVAYLLFRVADTLEDAELWGPSRRVAELARFAHFLRTGNGHAVAAAAAQWAANPGCAHEGYRDLLAALPELLDATARVDEKARVVIVEHVLRTIDGMQWFQLRHGEASDVRIFDLEDLRRYCYVVAGIVGEMLTELFVARGAVTPAAAPTLREHAWRFGEGLQLVNILKDEGDDARDGRAFLPPSVDRAVVFALAREGLSAADAYLDALRGGNGRRGVIAFTWLPVRLARATLALVERRGSGAKLSRAEVADHVRTVTNAA